MKSKGQKPEWVPQDSDEHFASHIMNGVEGGHDGLSKAKDAGKQQIIKRKKRSDQDYIHGVLAGDRTILAQAITLIESNAQNHLNRAQNVLNSLLSKTGKSIRIGISGIPGAGKSTFIEAFGLHLIELGHKVAVLAIDPSSSLTRGSILGDKTRMEKLSRHKESFIRPSPSGGALGGVARKTRETILLCEAAGFDIILVETIGVGQSEITVRSMVDFFLLLQIAGAGDELQGIKKGVMELADVIVVNKADGDNVIRAEATRADLEQALHYMQPATSGWNTKVLTCSSLTKNGIPEIWNVIDKFRKQMKNNGSFKGRRRLQIAQWLHSLINEQLKLSFYSNPQIQKILPEIEKQVLNREMATTTAVRRLLEAFDNSKIE
jgi:LAO/AO transport system kinase